MMKCSTKEITVQVFGKTAKKKMGSIPFMLIKQLPSA